MAHQEPGISNALAFLKLTKLSQTFAGQHWPTLTGNAIHAKRSLYFNVAVILTVIVISSSSLFAACIAAVASGILLASVEACSIGGIIGTAKLSEGGSSFSLLVVIR